MVNSWSTAGASQTILFASLVVVSAPSSLAQVTVCTAPLILTNKDLRSLADSLEGCQFRVGDLQIGSCDTPDECQVTSLEDTNAIREILDSFTVQCCASLTELSGFQSLQTVGNAISIYFNQNLLAISGLNSLRSTPALQVSQNPRLRTVSGFSNLSRIGALLEIGRNPVLYDLSGFRSLQTIQGAPVLLGFGLTLTYNTNLTSLSGFAGLSEISSGAIRIEGNSQLCYAGYPQWRVGSYPVRTEVVGGVDVGIDWRTKLPTSVPEWQYTWNIPGGGIPTIIIRANAPSSKCGEASCSSSCPPGAGCLGPDSPSLCGTCRRLSDGTNTCDAVPAPSSGGVNATAIALGICIPILIILLLLGVALGIWGVVVLCRKWRDIRWNIRDSRLNQELMSAA